jgi:NADH-quinone oxidoreductase subunit J
MELSAFAFYVVAGFTLVAALGVVVARSVVYSALLLIAAMVMTGLIYLLLLADFLALIQILVYGGTVSILLLFALMLTPPETRPRLTHGAWGWGAIAAIGIFVLIMVGVYGDTWAQPSGTRHVTIAELGLALFQTWAVPFEIASVVLLVALLGALTIARSATAASSAQAEGRDTKFAGNVGNDTE